MLLLPARGENNDCPQSRREINFTIQDIVVFVVLFSYSAESELCMTTVQRLGCTATVAWRDSMHGWRTLADTLSSAHCRPGGSAGGGTVSASEPLALPPFATPTLPSPLIRPVYCCGENFACPLGATAPPLDLHWLVASQARLSCHPTHCPATHRPSPPRLGTRAALSPVAATAA